MKKIERRTFLKGAAALSAGGIVFQGITSSGFSYAQEVHDSISPLGITDDLPNPPELRSVDGQLRAQIYMSYNLSLIHI